MKWNRVLGNFIVSVIVSIYFNALSFSGRWIFLQVYLCWTTVNKEARIWSVLNNEATKVWPACIRCSFTRSGHEVVDTDNQGFCRTTIRITKIDHKWSPTTILKMDKPKMTPDLIWLTPLMISTFLLSDHRIKTWSYPRVYFLYWLLWLQFFWCRGRLQRLEIDLGAGRPVGATEGIFMYHQIVHPVAKTEYGRVIKKTAQSQMNAVIVNSGVLVQCEILVIIVYVCINSFWPFSGGIHIWMSK